MPSTIEMLNVACATLACCHDAFPAPPSRAPDDLTGISLSVRESPAGAAIVASDPSGALIVVIGARAEAVSRIAGMLFPTVLPIGTGTTESRTDAALRNATDILASLCATAPKTVPMPASYYALLSLEGC